MMISPVRVMTAPTKPRGNCREPAVIMDRMEVSLANTSNRSVSRSLEMSTSPTLGDSIGGEYNTVSRAGSSWSNSALRPPYEVSEDR